MTEETVTSDEPQYYNNTSNIVADNEKETIYARRRAATKIADKQPDVVLTAENNTEFAALLQLGDPSDPSIKEFSLNYYGWTIEFDGNIANVMNYKDFKYYFNILVGAGDYSENTAYGPNFQFVNIGSNRYPDAVLTGQNVRVKAKVGTYDEDTELFELQVISIEAR